MCDRAGKVMSNCAVEFAETLSTYENLTKLLLYVCTAVDVSLTFFCCACVYTFTYCLIGCGIADDGVDALVEGLTPNSRLQALCLGSTFLMLFPSPLSVSSITNCIFGLAGNAFGLPGVSSLANYLQISSLRFLHLSGIYMFYFGIIAGFFDHHQYAVGSGIGNEGVRLLSAGLAGNNSLQILSLDCTYIDLCFCLLVLSLVLCFSCLVEHF